MQSSYSSYTRLYRSHWPPSFLRQSLLLNGKNPLPTHTHTHVQTSIWNFWHSKCSCNSTPYLNVSYTCFLHRDVKFEFEQKVVPTHNSCVGFPAGVTARHTVGLGVAQPGSYPLTPGGMISILTAYTHTATKWSSLLYKVISTHWNLCTVIPGI